ncbi:hypothetical protein [Thalassoglobus polymorphus]|uniref:Glycosyltransferase RgtA/B/C/D-like domain-containing protein n=1 Tax=Thalassoglobus polymorphus TaxID=2527994 RepID=A0A517QPP1_9PLAN|nr:hypothetical protein [Thalassoglobus polymorphus]QDT33557.1 hypothetical protein Mal48_28100 [Thalassoglobus polymorphus]
MIQDSNGPRPHLKDLFLPGLAAGILLIALGPLFLRLPVTNDAVLYDLEARWMKAGVLPYRDIVEANFPGVLVIHSLTRSSLGESNEALRIVDLTIVCTMLLLLLACVVKGTGSYRFGGWSAVFGLLFYLSLSEWCHCQRDIWLLLPAVGGCLLRILQVQRQATATSAKIFVHSLIEGCVWGLGIWLKPHLLIVCVVVWVMSIFMIQGWKRKAIDGSGLLAGGVIMGAIGLWSLMRLGALEAFLVSLREWNPGYLEARSQNWTLARYKVMNIILAPWTLLHLVAIPLSSLSVSRYLLEQFALPLAREERISLVKMLFATRQNLQTNSKDALQPAARNDQAFVRALLSAVYLFWLLQAHFLQHLFDYVHIPAILLSIGVLGVHAGQYRLLRTPAILLPLILLGLWRSPFTDANQMRLWEPATQGDLTPAETESLARLPNPKWEDLAEIESFLRDQNVHERDVLMFNSDLVTLYWNLNLTSPTPYVYLFELQNYFPERKELIDAAMINGPQKFVITDLVSCGMPSRSAEEIGPEGPLAPPPGYTRANLKAYPWSEPVVFRSGRYLVHKVRTEPVSE